MEILEKYQAIKESVLSNTDEEFDDFRYYGEKIYTAHDILDEVEVIIGEIELVDYIDLEHVERLNNLQDKTLCLISDMNNAYLNIQLKKILHMIDDGLKKGHQKCN